MPRQRSHTNFVGMGPYGTCASTNDSGCLVALEKCENFRGMNLNQKLKAGDKIPIKIPMEKESPRCLERRGIYSLAK